MAEAVQSLWPKTQVTIGPVIENGFYYDFAKQDPFHPDDLAKIEKRMHEIVAEERAVHEGGLEPQEGQGRSSGSAARTSRSSSSTRSPRARISRSTSRANGSTSAAARTWRPRARSAKRSSCRRSPAPTGAATPTSRCCSASTARRGRRKRSSPTTCTGSRKPRSATTASSAARWTSSISRRRRRARCSGIRTAGRCFRRSSPTCGAGSVPPAISRSTLPT